MSIERAKTRLVAETIYSTDSQSSLARIYGSALAIGETIEEVRRWPAEIEAVTPDDLAAAAERYLDAAALGDRLPAQCATAERRQLDA